MNAERLLALYERVAEAPDAIARLRRFILDLAVRAKLVPQDPQDEPASELLKRIAKEKARLIRDGKFKTFEGNLDHSPSAFSFEVPLNWSWCYLDDIAAVARGGSPRPIEAFITVEPNGIPWIKIGDSQRGSVFIDETKERIKPEGLAKSRLVIPGDLLLSNSMSFGFPYITNVEGCIHDGWLVIRTPAGMLDKLYLHKVLLSGHAKAEFSEAAAGAVVQNLNADKARQLSVPLPPLAEQHRIVAKVDELMALCDRLEAARKDRETKRDRLSAASLARLNTPDPETFTADALFTLEALPALTTRPNQIKQLRQTILNLAIRGKLVPQDPNNEPASELLKRIAKEQIDQAALPSGWRRTKVGSILDFQYGKGLKAAERLDEGPVPVFGSNGIVGFTDEPLTAHPSIIVGRKGSAGALNLCDGPSWTTDVAYFVEAPSFLDIRFLLSALAALDLDKLGKGVKPGLSRSEAYDQIIAIPPLAEQHRIVAKVDELMALCDRLETSLTTSNQTRTRLLEATLSEALGKVVMHELGEI
jgi:type I restriction enzyme, S subunit